jgi:hypothetical protein
MSIDETKDVRDLVNIRLKEQFGCGIIKTEPNFREKCRKSTAKLFLDCATWGHRFNFINRKKQEETLALVLPIECQMHFAVVKKVTVRVFAKDLV